MAAPKPLNQTPRFFTPHSATFNHGTQAYTKTCRPSIMLDALHLNVNFFTHIYTAATPTQLNITQHPTTQELSTITSIHAELLSSPTIPTTPSQMTSCTASLLAL